MAGSEWVSEKNSKFKNMNILYIALKHVIWRFEYVITFAKYFKFRDFMNTLRNFAKFVFARISRNLNISRKNFILTESPDHVL